jgi:hypothetical protein
MNGRAKQAIAALSLVTASLLAAGCKKSEPANGGPVADTIAVKPASLQIVSIDVGRHVGADMKISDPTTTFAPNDTMYVAVTAQGTASNAAMGAKWSKGAELVKEMDGTVSGTGPPFVTSFHIENPKGWPKGDYTVEITLDGNTVGTKTLSVK